MHSSGLKTVSALKRLLPARLRALAHAWVRSGADTPPAFNPGEHGEFPRRGYATYSDYLEHQKRKLDLRADDIGVHDLEYEEIVYSRYCRQIEWQGLRVLCLGARLGGEVRAFKRMGALAVGIDLNPGVNNPDVLYGDFHEIRFPDSCFDVVFTNSLDHSYLLDQLIQEVRRILCPAGRWLLEVGDLPPARFESIDLTARGLLLERLGRLFVMEDSSAIDHQSRMGRWDGFAITLVAGPVGENEHL